MATKDTVVQELVVNTLTHKQFKAAQEAGTLSPYELYGTPDTSARLPVLTPMWFDHITNDVSWLRADTFSWHSGDVYVAAYEHLAEDIDSATAETETIGDITIAYYRAEDGHKICLPDQESNMSALYEATGVAWYYILDADNKQFKLPRTKFGFTGLRDIVGGYVAPGLPNIEGTYDGVVYLSSYNSTSVPMTGTGALYTAKNSSGTMHITSEQGGNRVAKVIGFDASLSNAAYGNSTTVQPPATQMHLYFFVGNFEQDSVEQTAGINAEMFNSKADIDLGNIPANYDYVVESQLPTADNGYTWYRKYKSGWVEQGGLSTVGPSTSETKTLPIEMADTNYTIISGLKRTTNSGSGHSSVGGTVVSTTQIKLIGDYNDSGTGSMQGAYWQVSGQAA